MTQTLGRLLVAVLAMSMAVGCMSSSTYRKQSRVGEFDILTTSAELRNNLIVTRPDGTQITCAEPSPDVAKAVSASLGAGVQVKGQGGGEFAASRAEALAQLTQRLATIQLLRDALYRACEAYANGAINDTIYAVILSRYDDMMITMLLAEFVAGNFGGPLATLGTSASAEATAEAVTAAEKELADAKAELAKKPDDAAAKKRVETAQSKLDQAKAGALLVGSKAEALAAQLNAATTTMRTGDATVTALKDMHKAYLDDANADALAVACLTAMDRYVDDETLLSAKCQKWMQNILAPDKPGAGNDG